MSDCIKEYDLLCVIYWVDKLLSSVLMKTGGIHHIHVGLML